MLRISVGVAIFAHLPLFEFVGEVRRRPYSFGVAPHADCGLDIILGNVGVDCAGCKHRIRQVRCPGRKGESQRKGSQQEFIGFITLQLLGSPLLVASVLSFHSILDL